MLRFVEGFETRQALEYLSRVWASVLGAVVNYPSPRKAGTACARAVNCTLKSYPLVPSDTNTWIVSFGYFMENAASTTVTVMNAAGTEQLTLQFAAGTTFNTFTIAVKRGVTTLATSAELSMSRWHFFEFKATIRTSTNGSYELIANGNTILSASGVNTASTGSDGASVFQFNWGGGISSFDDIFICDDAGGIHDDFLGDKVILGILPTTDGASSQWVPSTGSNHAALVDDVATAASTTDYVYSEVTGDLDLFEFENLTAMADDGTLDAVVVFPSVQMRSSGSRGLKVRFRASGGSTGDSAQFDVASKSIQSFVIPFDEDPVAAAAWTKAALDGGQLGVLNFVEL